MANIGTSAVKLIDSDGDALDNGDGKLNVLLYAGGHNIVGGTGVVNSGTLRVTIATDDPHWGEVGAAADNDGVAHGQLLAIANYTQNVSGMLGYTIVPTGSQYSEGTGSLVPIVRNDTLASLVTDDNDFAPLQVNADGALYIDGSNSTQPVSGTVTANLSATDNAVLDAMVVDLAAMEALLITIDSDTDAIKTAVEKLDDWDDSNYANVNINLAGSDAPTGGGTESGVLRVTLANDSTGVISIDDGGGSITVDNAGTFATQIDGDALTSLQLLDDVVGTDNTTGPAKCVSIGGSYAATNTIQEIAVDQYGNIQVDVVGGTITATGTGTFAVQSTLQAGSAAIGKLAANSGVDIGDVDVTSIAAGDNNIGNVDIASALPAGSNTIGVVDLGSTDNAVLDAIAASLALLDNSIASGNELQVDVVAALPAGSNAIGKLAANSGVDIGDVDVTSISAGTNAIGKVGHDITGMTHGTNADVDTTAEQLDGSTSGLDVACKRVDLMASPANSGKIYVGGSDTIGAAAGGMQLEAGDFYSIDIDNLNQIWVEASIADQGLKYIYFT